ncbi:hypothetical protein M5K25_022722 [Dendrobium thyrsiflorum]|uniref:Uncharacterized protein n=1 Tax=Dendrobium thyrsiflorum TaxID=117978 RepID=A0ABD0U6L8_DENTH
MTIGQMTRREQGVKKGVANRWELAYSSKSRKFINDDGTTLTTRPDVSSEASCRLGQRHSGSRQCGSGSHGTTPTRQLDQTWSRDDADEAKSVTCDIPGSSRVDFGFPGSHLLYEEHPKSPKKSDKLT